MNTATLKNKQRSPEAIKFEENIYFIIQLYYLSKISAKKKMPGLPINDNRKNISTILAKPKHADIRNSLLHKLHVIAAPVFKRTAA
jgi:hypothetical protein